MESRTSSSDGIKIAIPPCRRLGSDDVRAVAIASSTSGFPQERWQLLRKVKSKKTAVCSSGIGWMDVQVEARCGSHGKSRVSVGPWLLCALAPPTGPAGVPFPECTGPRAAAVLKEKHPGPTHWSLAEPQEMNSLVYGSGYTVLPGSCHAKPILV